MDQRSEAPEGERKRIKGISAQESVFPYDGIFSPRGFLSTIPSSSSDDPAEDSASGKVDGECQDQLLPTKTVTKSTSEKSQESTCTSDANTSNPDTDSVKYGLAPSKFLETAHFPEETPEEQVFKNHLVIKAIFKKLDTDTLKHFRAVSKNFNNFATEILLLRQSLKILIVEDQVVRNNKFTGLYLNEALESITNSIKLFHRLPTDYLELNETELKAPALQNFLSEYGYLVKTLKLEFYDKDVTILTIQHLLLHQVVNLDTLVLDCVLSDGDKNCEDLKLFRDNNGWTKINSLKTVIFRTRCSLAVPTNFLKGLVCASANLQQIKGCEGTHFLAFLPSDDTTATASSSSTSLSKLHLLKTLTFDPSPEALTQCSQFLDSQGELPTGLQIQKLKIQAFELKRHSETWQQAASILTRFLKMISPTVETLVIKSSLDFLGENVLQFPKFDSVTKVHFVIRECEKLSDTEKSMMPSNNQIVTTFPNVQHLKITIDVEDLRIDEEEFFNYFGNPSPILSLKTLEFIGDCLFRLPLCWLEKFSARTPNIKVANIGGLSIEDFRKACQAVWTQLVNLQELTFTLDVVGDGFEKDGEMDMAFTGFSEETCKRLMKEQFDRIQKSQNQKPGIENIERVMIRAEDWKDKRENPSILNLKSLTILRVYFDVSLGLGLTDPNLVLLSCVAGLYAFEMCDGLKVTVGVVPSCPSSRDYCEEVLRDVERTTTELTTSLESIRPYITLDSFLN